MTKAQQIYERVEALVDGGATKVDAYTQVAAELGLKPNSVRGAYYQHTKKLGGSSAKSRRRETTPTDATDAAKAVLQDAVDSIDGEIEAAKERADEAKAEFEALKASAQERKDAIAAKIDALDA